jgi:hypothetical protein
MSARDRLFNDIWDMRSATEKNALIDAVLAEHAHELAEKIRKTVDDVNGNDLMRTFFRGAANVIDPAAQKP